MSWWGVFNMKGDRDYLTWIYWKKSFLVFQWVNPQKMGNLLGEYVEYFFLWHLKQIQILFRCICVYVCFSKTPLACIPSCSFLKFGVPQKGYAPSSTDDTFWSPLSLAPCIFLWDNIGSGWRTYLQDSSRNFYCRTSISLPNVLQQILTDRKLELGSAWFSGTDSF